MKKIPSHNFDNVSKSKSFKLSVDKFKTSIIKVKLKFSKSYYVTPDIYNRKIINDIVFNEKSNTVALFKDYLIFDDNSEFLKRFYKKNELKERLIKILSYYTEYSKIFPNYIILPEAKYIYKNIQRKQRMIDNQQILEIKAKKKTKKLKNDDDLDSEVFNTRMVDSIMNMSHSQLLLNETQDFINPFSGFSIVNKGINGSSSSLFGNSIKNKVQCDSMENLIDLINGKMHTKDFYALKPKTNSFLLTNGFSLTKIENLKSPQAKIKDKKVFKLAPGHIKFANSTISIDNNPNSSNTYKDGRKSMEIKMIKNQTLSPLNKAAQEDIIDKTLYGKLSLSNIKSIEYETINSTKSSKKKNPKHRIVHLISQILPLFIQNQNYSLLLINLKVLKLQNQQM